MDISRVVPNLQSGRKAADLMFYADFLGFEVAMDMGWITTLVSPTNPNVQVSILSGPDPSGQQPDISIEVADVEGLYAQARARGLQIVYPLTMEPWGVQRFFVLDPDGRVINVLSHAK